MGFERIGPVLNIITTLALGASAPALAAANRAVDPASVAAFEAELAKHDSATEALRQWCEAHAIAVPAEIMARPVQGPAGRRPIKLRQLLGIGTAEAIGYRHVELICGEHVLSVAHNWFVPSRLTAEMNTALTTTQVPFGRIVAPLGYRREPLEVLKQPPRGCPPNTISAHRALLRLPDGRVLAYVLECYTAENLR